MCLNERRSCECGLNSVFLSFRDNLLPPEILLNLSCPECRGDAVWDESTMLADCGWVLEYDVERAQAYFDLRGIRQLATPDFLFDEGYLSWQGLAPGDHEVNAQLHRRLEPLVRQDYALYLKTLKTEWLAHVAGLKAAGWRKAQAT
jgi:hypothetical protein